MRKMLISGAAALLCTAAALPAVAAPAANNDTSQNTAQPSREQARDGNRRVCVRSAPLSNSRISRPVCRTQAEWDRMRANGELDED